MSYNSIAALSAYSNSTVNFGKYKGKTEASQYSAAAKTGGVGKHEGKTEISQYLGAVKTGGVAGPEKRNKDMALIHSFGANRGINATETYGLDGSPYPPEGKGINVFTYA